MVYVADCFFDRRVHKIGSAHHNMCSCAHLMLKTRYCISCVSPHNILPLFSLSSCLSLQESSSIVLKGSGGLRGASKFLVKKVDEYALLSKDKGGGGPPGGGGGGDNKGSSGPGGGGGPPSGGPAGGGDGKHFILCS